MPQLAPVLAEKARKLRAAGHSINSIAAELGISAYQVKRATTDGFAERQRERWRKVDAERAEKRASDPQWQAYQLAHYHATKGFTADDARRLAEALKEHRRQYGLEQADAAKEFGRTLPQYQRWEAGECPRSLIRLVSLALRGLRAPKSGGSDPRR